MIRINYGINRKGKRGRIEHDNGSLELSDVPANLFELNGTEFDAYHAQITGLIRERHPGWLITGFAPASEDSGRVFQPGGALALNLEDSGQNFAGVATIRAAIFDVLDHGDQDGQRWAFYENPHEGFAKGTFAWTEDNANTERSNFVDAVIARIAELQAPPHEGIKLENLCDKHKRECLPAPTAKVCRMCEAERNAVVRNGVPR